MSAHLLLTIVDPVQLVLGTRPSVTNPTVLGDESAPLLSMARASVHPLKRSSPVQLHRPRSYSFTCPVHGGSSSENTQSLLAHSCFTLLCLVCHITGPPCGTMRFLTASWGISIFIIVSPCVRSCTMWYFHFFIISHLSLFPCFTIFS